MSSRAGTKQIVFCNAGTLAGTPGNPIALGFRGALDFVIGQHKTFKDYREREMRNMVNFKLEPETYQVTMKLMSALCGWVNGNADIQVVTNKQSSSATSDDVFKFVGNNIAGIGFELNISDDKRSIKIPIERAMEYDEALTFIDAADSETAVAISGLPNIEGVDSTIYKAPRYQSIESPAATEVFSKLNLIERTLNIKTVSTKDRYNMDVVDYLKVAVTLIGLEASIAKYITELNKAMTTSLIWKEKNSSSSYAAFDIASNVLSKKDELTIGDKNRKLKLIYEGMVPLYDTSFLFGDGNGGLVEDSTGLTGGTFKLGY